MVEVYYYFAESVATLSQPWVTFGPSDQPSQPITSVSSLSQPDAALGDPRPVCAPITSAASLSTPTAILLGVVATCQAMTSAATASTPTVVFGAVTATCQAMTAASSLSATTAILGAVDAPSQVMTSAATMSTPTASIGMLVATCKEILSESSLSTPTASVTYPSGQQRHPKHRRPRPLGKRFEYQKGAVRIYAGMCLGGRGNEVWPLRASDGFAGFAVESSSVSDPRIIVQRGGTVHLPVTGVSSAAAIGSRVYAIHDDSFTLTNAAGYVPIGRVQSHIAGSICVVAFDADGISWP